MVPGDEILRGKEIAGGVGEKAAAGESESEQLRERERDIDD